MKVISKLTHSLFYLLYITGAGFLLIVFVEDATRSVLAVLKGDPSYLNVSNKNGTPFYAFSPTAGDNKKNWVRYEKYYQMLPHQGPLSVVYYPGQKPYSMFSNSLGLRGRGFSEPQHESIIRIMTFGGSSTYGVESNDDETWPAYAERYINDLLTQNGSRLRAETVNAGIPAADIYSILHLFESQKNISFDYLFLYSAYNNSVFLQELKNRYFKNQISSYLSQNSLVYSWLKQQYDKRLKPQKTSSPALPPGNMQSKEFQAVANYFQQLLDLAQSRGIKVVVILQPSNLSNEIHSPMETVSYNSTLQRYYIQESKKEPARFSLIDPLQAFSKYVANEKKPDAKSFPYKYVFHDAVHLNSNGNNLLGKVVGEQFFSILIETENTQP